eukprot:TRINITY_DN21414_c0_g3_i2.p1 TRINITY_DN21414_c0_g3~~TRINITY_DN21414_c0_g3_i2.p1  ORF type:complete len:1491 (+),score=369.84 TRINITY_DN21414_c0_g3_i2:86-4474(+)
MKTILGVPMPPWAREESVLMMHAMQLERDDVFLCSFPKTGTTWVNRILFCLLRMNADGEFPPWLDLGTALGYSVQVYPDWVPLDRPADPDWPGIGPGGVMGKLTWGDLMTQPRPRLFSTHAPAALLPASLAQGSGRLVYVTRNPKDTMCSLHYFRGEPKDGWHGNEHGPGTLARFLSGDQNYGSFFQHCRGIQEWMNTHTRLRCHVVNYETLHANFSGEVNRLAAFLDVPMTPQKLGKIADLTSFSTMKSGPGEAGLMLRKGVCGDWVNAPLTPRQWRDVEDKFTKELGGLPIARPMQQYMALTATPIPAPARPHRRASSKADHATLIQAFARAVRARRRWWLLQYRQRLCGEAEIIAAFIHSFRARQLCAARAAARRSAPPPRRGHQPAAQGRASPARPAPTVPQPTRPTPRPAPVNTQRAPPPQRQGPSGGGGAFLPAVANGRPSAVATESPRSPSAEQLIARIGALNREAVSLTEQGQYDAARGILDQMPTHLARVRCQRTRACLESTTRNNLGCLEKRLGNLDDAAYQLEQALKLEYQYAEPAPSTVLNLTAVMQSQGCFNKARDLARLCLELLQQAPGGQPPAVWVAAWHNLAVAQMQATTRPESEETVWGYFAQATKIATQNFSAGHHLSVAVADSWRAAKEAWRKHRREKLCGPDDQRSPRRRRRRPKPPQSSAAESKPSPTTGSLPQQARAPHPPQRSGGPPGSVWDPQTQSWWPPPGSSASQAEHAGAAAKQAPQPAPARQRPQPAAEQRPAEAAEAPPRQQRQPQRPVLPPVRAPPVQRQPLPPPQPQPPPRPAPSPQQPQQAKREQQGALPPLVHRTAAAAPRRQPPQAPAPPRRPAAPQAAAGKRPQPRAGAEPAPAGARQPPHRSQRPAPAPSPAAAAPQPTADTPAPRSAQSSAELPLQMLAQMLSSDPSSGSLAAVRALCGQGAQQAPAPQPAPTDLRPPASPPGVPPELLPLLMLARLVEQSPTVMPLTAVRRLLESARSAAQPAGRCGLRALVASGNRSASPRTSSARPHLDLLRAAGGSPRAHVSQRRCRGGAAVDVPPYAFLELLLRLRPAARYVAAARAAAEGATHPFLGLLLRARPGCRYVAAARAAAAACCGQYAMLASLCQLRPAAQYLAALRASATGPHPMLELLHHAAPGARYLAALRAAGEGWGAHAAEGGDDDFAFLELLLATDPEPGALEHLSWLQHMLPTAAGSEHQQQQPQPQPPQQPSAPSPRQHKQQRQVGLVSPPKPQPASPAPARPEAAEMLSEHGHLELLCRDPTALCFDSLHLLRPSVRYLELLCDAAPAAGAAALQCCFEAARQQERTSSQLGSSTGTSQLPAPALASRYSPNRDAGGGGRASPPRQRRFSEGFRHLALLCEANPGALALPRLVRASSPSPTQEFRGLGLLQLLRAGHLSGSGLRALAASAGATPAPPPQYSNLMALWRCGGSQCLGLGRLLDSS